MKGKELTVMQQAGLPAQLTALKADAPEGAKYLPTLNFGWAIMLNDHSDLKVNHLFIDNGGNIKNIEEPILVTTLASRNSLRKLVEKDGKKVYFRGYEPYDGGKNESADNYATLLKMMDDGDGDVQKGATVLLAIKMLDSGRITVAACEMFKTFQGAFWFALSESCNFEEKKGTKLTISDWRVAMKESKAGNAYPVSNKVANYTEAVDLDTDQLAEFAGAFNANSDGIETWLAR